MARKNQDLEYLAQFSFKWALCEQKKLKLKILKGLGSYRWMQLLCMKLDRI